MRFRVEPRRSISESPPAGCTRRVRSVAWIWSTSARIASTGASARPVTRQISHAGEGDDERQPDGQPEAQVATRRRVAVASDVIA